MLKVYTITQNEEWDSIVKSFNSYDVYYLSGYAKSFMTHGDGDPLLFYFECASLRGISVVMKRDIACDPFFVGSLDQNKYFDIATPYGYGGWLFEGDYSKESEQTFNHELSEWCNDNSIVSEFVRFHPLMNNIYDINKQFYSPVLKGKTVAIQLDSKESIWERFSSKKPRPYTCC